MTIIYSKKPLRDRQDSDFYPTPIEFCRAALSILSGIPKYADNPAPTALDVGAGDGVWGQALKGLSTSAHLTGIDVRESAKGNSATYLFDRGYGLPINAIVYDEWILQDFADHDRKYDLIFGNIPFRYTNEFIQHSLDLLADNGIILFLLRSAVSESKKRYDMFYNNGHKPIYEYQSVRRISFMGDKGSDNTAYSVFIWEKQKDFQRETIKRWLYWEYDDKHKTTE